VVATLRSGHDHSFVDVPVLVHDVLPVDEPSALRILDAGAPHLSGPERELVLRQAQGNPLALVELPKAWRAPMPPGRTAAFLPSAMPITERLQRAFAGRMVDLPQASRDLLPIAAADDSGDTGEIIAAASELAGHPVTTEAADVAVRSGLVTYDGPRLRFQHLRDLAADVRARACNAAMRRPTCASCSSRRRRRSASVCSSRGEPGVPLHAGDRHAGVAQAAQGAQPGHVVVGEGAPAVRGAADVGEQSDALVVAQRVDAEAGLLGYFAGE
jgi:hypothetical protein